MRTWALLKRFGNPKVVFNRLFQSNIQADLYFVMGWVLRAMSTAEAPYGLTVFKCGHHRRELMGLQYCLANPLAELLVQVQRGAA